MTKKKPPAKKKKKILKPGPITAGLRGQIDPELLDEDFEEDFHIERDGDKLVLRDSLGHQWYQVNREPRDEE